MIRINCPYCGLRGHEEFSYIGDATKQRPASPADATAAEWHNYVYIRDNPRGPHQEIWQHIQGCRAFVRVLRNTLTHEVLATGLPQDDLLVPLSIPKKIGEAS
jgi:sarcosine oxidase subunit delta